MKRQMSTLHRSVSRSIRRLRKGLQHPFQNSWALRLIREHTVLWQAFRRLLAHSVRSLRATREVLEAKARLRSANCLSESGRSDAHHSFSYSAAAAVADLEVSV